MTTILEKSLGAVAKG
ncbi:hypothetical protein AB9F39_37190, partial [Rhizobium leguminosarum]